MEDYFLGVLAVKTMAARGLVNGRGPSLRRCSGGWELVHVFQSVLLGMGGIAP